MKDKFHEIVINIDELINEKPINVTVKGNLNIQGDNNESFRKVVEDMFSGKTMTPFEEKIIEKEKQKESEMLFWALIGGLDGQVFTNLEKLFIKYANMDLEEKIQFDQELKDKYLKMKEETES